MEPIFFTSPDEFRAWLEEHHADAVECQVGFWKSHTGKPSLTWSQSVDQALCFGWIDGRGGSLGDDAWSIRFTPRKARSNWSLVNIQKVADLTASGLMRPAGVAAFERRDKDGPGTYSHEQGELVLESEQQELFEKDGAAWEWFAGQAPSYRKAAIHWVTGAKKAETRERRLAQLIADSAAQLRVKPLRRP